MIAGRRLRSLAPSRGRRASLYGSDRTLWTCGYGESMCGIYHVLCHSMRYGVMRIWRGARQRGQRLFWLRCVVASQPRQMAWLHNHRPGGARDSPSGVGQGDVMVCRHMGQSWSSGSVHHGGVAGAVGYGGVTVGGMLPQYPWACPYCASADTRSPHGMSRSGENPPIHTGALLRVRAVRMCVWRLERRRRPRGGWYTPAAIVRASASLKRRTICRGGSLVRSSRAIVAAAMLPML